MKLNKNNNGSKMEITTAMVQTYATYHPSTRRIYDVGSNDGKLSLVEAIEAKLSIDPNGAWEGWLPATTIKKVRQFAA